MPNARHAIVANVQSRIEPIVKRERGEIFRAGHPAFSSASRKMGTPQRFGSSSEVFFSACRMLSVTPRPCQAGLPGTSPVSFEMCAQKKPASSQNPSAIRNAAPAPARSKKLYFVPPAGKLFSVKMTFGAKLPNKRTRSSCKKFQRTEGPHPAPSGASLRSMAVGVAPVVSIPDAPSRHRAEFEFPSAGKMPGAREANVAHIDIAIQAIESRLRRKIFNVNYPSALIGVPEDRQASLDCRRRRRRIVGRSLRCLRSILRGLGLSLRGCACDRTEYERRKNPGKAPAGKFHEYPP